MKTKKLIKVMYVFSWLALMGLFIKTSIILTNYFLSIYTPEAASNVYEGMNLIEYRNYSFLHYSLLVGYKIIFFSTETYIAYLVMKLLQKLDINEPFNIDLHTYMQRISMGIFYLWIVAIIHNTHMQFVGQKHHFELYLFSSDFVFLSGVIFIFAQIVKQGVSIKSENDLTI